MNGTKSEPCFRKMKFEDLEAVCAIDRESFSLPWPETSFRHEISNNAAARFWVAEDLSAPGNAKVIGMLGGWLIVDEFHIGTLAIKKEFRGLHVGKKLFIFAMNEVYKQGVQSVFLEVRRSNRIAQQMYRGLGFEMEGVRERYYSDNHEDAILMNLGNLSLEKIASWQQIEKNKGVPCLMK